MQLMILAASLLTALALSLALAALTLRGVLFLLMRPSRAVAAPRR